MMDKFQKHYPEGRGEKKCLTYRGTGIRIAADFLSKTIQARKEVSEIIKVLKDVGMVVELKM